MEIENSEGSASVEWQLDDFDRELENMRSIHEKNIQHFKEIVESFEKSLQIRNPIKGECDKISETYLKEQKNTTEAYEQYNQQYNLLLKKEKSLGEAIDKIKAESGNKSKELNSLEEDLKSAKKTYKINKKAFKIALEKYKNFGFDIKVVVNDENNTFVAILVFFDDKNQSPVKFTIDPEQNKVLDFDAGSLLPQDEQEDLKMRYKESHNTLQLMCELKKKIIGNI